VATSRGTPSRAGRRRAAPAPTSPSTDEAAHPASIGDASPGSLASSLDSAYERAYYSGLVAERRARALNAHPQVLEPDHEPATPLMLE
jgi:hypothetical protein